MSAETSYEFGVFGSTPMATLIAGLLARTHRRRVLLVGDRPSPFRLVRGLDLSVMLTTRPEAWALLSRTAPETLKLLSRLGARAALQRFDPLFIAATPEAADALAHMRHLATGFGYNAERLPDAGSGAVASYRLRDAAVLDRLQFDPAAADWLAKGEVRRLPAFGATVDIRRDGSGRAVFEGETVAFERAVLADDPTILAHLPAGERAKLFAVRRAGALLTEPAGPLPAPVMIYPDRAVTLLQRPNGAILALAEDGSDPVATLGDALPIAMRQVQRTAATQFSTPVPADGAVLCGSSGGFKGTILAGFGSVGAFLAPAIARHLAGVADELEQAYFAAREPGAESRAVDFVSRAPAEAAA